MSCGKNRDRCSEWSDNIRDSGNARTVNTVELEMRESTLNWSRCGKLRRQMGLQKCETERKVRSHWMRCVVLRCRAIPCCVSVCVCLSVCLSAIISHEPHARSLPMFVRVACGHGSVLLRRNRSRCRLGWWLGWALDTICLIGDRIPHGKWPL